MFVAMKTFLREYNIKGGFFLQIPSARKIPHPHVLHGDVREDDYYWLNERENSLVIDYLEEENRYYEKVMQPITPLIDHIYEAMIARIVQQETTVAVQDGDYYYYQRQDKDLQYPVYARKKAQTRDELSIAKEEVILDLNALANSDEYLSVTLRRMSPDQKMLAYLINHDGTDRYTLVIKDVLKNTMLPDRIENVFIDDSVEWSLSGEDVFYITVDDNQRPFQVWRHTLRGQQPDVLLYEEQDTTCEVTLSKTRSGRFFLVHSKTKTSSEVRYLDFAMKQSELTIFDERKPDVIYDVEQDHDDFLILTNEDAPNFQVLHAPINQPMHRKHLISYDPARFITGVYPFDSGLVIEGRQDGLTQVWTFHHGEMIKLPFVESVYKVELAENLSYQTKEALLLYESFVTPRSTLRLDIEQGNMTVLDIASVPDDYDSRQYQQERIFAKADDGTKVPVTMVYKSSAVQQGPAPLILYGYGSYGSNRDPDFDAKRLALLDLGVIFAVAQVRGGSEMGRTWYDDGKLLHKRNSFTDFIACAKHLIDHGYTTSDQIAAWGRSAGGLLMGAVANMAGDLFKVIVPGVPFVDVVTTMLDETIPLTTLEWDEWGNPNDEVYYQYMKSYSPYDQVQHKVYPHMLVTTGINDPRVGYFEPAKWVARLREYKTDDHILLLKTNMGAGHFGASGRFNQVRELAATFAFMLNKIGYMA